MGKRGPKPTNKAAAPPPPKPKGKGPIKRTPTSAFDVACEKIVGQRLAKGGITQYNVKWQDALRPAEVGQGLDA